MLSSQSDEPFDEKFTLRISKVMATNGAGGWRITTKRFTRENTNKQTDAAYRVGVKAQRMLPFAYFVFHFFLQGGVSQASWRVIEAIQHFRTSVPVRFCFVDKMTECLRVPCIYEISFQTTRKNGKTEKFSKKRTNRDGAVLYKCENKRKAKKANEMEGRLNFSPIPQGKTACS